MAKQFMGAVMALVATFILAACGSMPQQRGPVTAPTATRPAVQVAPQQQMVQSAPQVVQPQVTVAPAPQVAPPAVGQFPTSKQKPVGSPWQTMHTDGFTGSVDDACKLMGLTTRQCATYKAKRSAGECVAMQIPNGVVLDALTFSRNGKHFVQRNVKVDLQNPISREAVVCNIGGGVQVIDLAGCGNRAAVFGWNPKPPMAPLPAKPVAQAPAPVVPECTVRSFVRLHVWTNAALELPGVREAVAAEARHNHYDDPQGMSRSKGLLLRTQGVPSAMGHPFSMNILKADGSARSHFTGIVTGSTDVRLPADFTDSDILQVVFQDQSKVISPNRDLRSRGREFRWCITSVHAIER